MYWCKQDNPAQYNEINQRDVDLLMDSCAMNPTHEDLAKILHKLYRNDFVCTKGNVWYENSGHRWRLSDNGYGLREKIKEMRNIFFDKKRKMSEMQSIALANNNNSETLPVAVALQDGGGDALPKAPVNETRVQQLQTLQKKYTDIYTKLGDTNMKDNIMKEARELFYDGDFVGKLDEKPRLLCFTNGIVDFEQGVFRRGHPEDYISMCTNIDYVPMEMARCEDGAKVDVVYDEAQHGAIRRDIEDFMCKIYPDAELRRYMWDHLASALTGTENQTFNMYIGKGSNGKSVLTKLMADVLGDYKRDVPLTLITEKRQKVGGLAPEIAELKGVRYAVMQESSKGDAVNEGVLKQLTSGTDTIQGRQLYASAPTRFIPQFKLVMCSNEFLDIRSMDGGTWRRMRVVNHVSRFVDNPDPRPEKHEFKKLTETEIQRKMTPLWKRLFVSMLVARAFVTEGVVRDCTMVTEASEAYKARQDLIGSFVAEKLADDAAAQSLKKEELSNVYKEWWSSTQDGRVSKRDELWTYMEGKYGKYCKTGGWKGVKVVYPDSSAVDGGDDYSVLSANRSVRL